MISIDTNILLRYLVFDDPAQGEKAAQIIDRSARDEQLLFISHVVLCETVWVLESYYDLSKEQILDTLEKVFETAQFEIEMRDAARLAIEDFRKEKVDYADCLSGRRNLQLGSEKTLTFDRSLRKLAYFEVI